MKRVINKQKHFALDLQSVFAWLRLINAFSKKPDVEITDEISSNQFLLRYEKRSILKI